MTTRPTFRFPAGSLACFVLFATAPLVSGQAVWTVTNLHPAGASGSTVYALSGALAGGSTAAPFSNYVPTRWVGGTPEVLDAGGGGYGVVQAMTSTAQGGQIDGTAAIWNDGVMTLLDSAGHSEVRAMSGNLSAGVTDDQAAVWTGTNPEPTIVHPAGAYSSAVYAMSGTQLGGSVNYDKYEENAVWWSSIGAAEVNLNPGAGFTSRVAAMTATQQGGFVIDENGTQSATLWSGTAASAINLNGSFFGSEITAMVDGFQIGNVFTEGDTYAALWMGSAGSYVDLSSYVLGSSAFSGSYFTVTATSASVEGGILYVGGFALNGTNSDYEAFLMSTPVSSLTAVPEPSTYATIAGAAALALAWWRRRRLTRSRLPGFELEAGGRFAGC